MSAYVTDTHALLWYLSADPALSDFARQLFEQADVAALDIFVPSIVLVEVVYLAERQRVSLDRIDAVLDLLRMPGSRYHVVALDLALVDALRRIDRQQVPDMPDRVIAATALHLDLPLISRDRKIQACTLVNCVW